VDAGSDENPSPSGLDLSSQRRPSGREVVRAQALGARLCGPAALALPLQEPWKLWSFGEDPEPGLLACERHHNSTTTRDVCRGRREPTCSLMAALLGDPETRSSLAYALFPVQTGRQTIKMNR